MKNSKVTSALLLFVTLLQTGFAAVPASFQPNSLSEAGTNHLVKATRINGEWIPVIDLPEVEITAIKKNSIVLGALSENNQVVLYANLPAIEITAEAKTQGKVRTGCHNGSFLILADLPVIEITSEFPDHKLVDATHSGNIPVVNLPEVVISANPGYLAAAVETPYGVNPVVNLPEVVVAENNKSGASGSNVRYYPGSSRWSSFIAAQTGLFFERLLRKIIF